MFLECAGELAVAELRFGEREGGQRDAGVFGRRQHAEGWSAPQSLPYVCLRGGVAQVYLINLCTSLLNKLVHANLSAQLY